MRISVKKTLTAVAIGSALIPLTTLPAKATPEKLTNMTTQKTVTPQTLQQKLISWRLLTNKTIAKRDFWLKQMLLLKRQTQSAVRDRNKKEIELNKVIKILEELSKSNNSLSPQNETNQNTSSNTELTKVQEAKDIAQKEYLKAKTQAQNLYDKFLSARKSYMKLIIIVRNYSATTKSLETAYAKEQWVIKTRTNVVNAAKSRIGAAYTYGGEGPWGFDCSGLTMWSYAQVGIEIPHYSGAQMITPQAVPVPVDRMLPGDLMYFGAGGSRHVAMYIGNGEIIEANNPSTGVRVDPAFASWNMYDYAGSTRLIY